jgi:predicted NACHT family NTPase
MLENADVLMQLMQQHSNGLMAADEKLQQFLIWLYQKSLSVEAPYKSAAIRAFYLTLVLPSNLKLVRDLSLALAIDLKLASDLAPDLMLDRALNHALSISQALTFDPSMDRFLALNFALPHDQAAGWNPKLQGSLQLLKEQLPIFALDRESLKEWWKANGQIWTEKLKSLMLRDRNIGHQWQFSEQQKELLKQYYAAKYLLVDCLNSRIEVTASVREKIEETLLLPIADIGSLA